MQDKYHHFKVLMKTLNITRDSIIMSVKDNRKGRVEGFIDNLIAVRFQDKMMCEYYDEETFKKCIKKE